MAFSDECPTASVVQPSILFLLLLLPPLLLPSTSSQVSKLRSDCGDSVNKMEGMEYELARRQKKIDECETEIDRLVKKGDWHEAERRRLHNTIQV